MDTTASYTALNGEELPKPVGTPRRRKPVHTRTLTVAVVSVALVSLIALGVALSSTDSRPGSQEAGFGSMLTKYINSFIDWLFGTGESRDSPDTLMRDSVIKNAKDIWVFTTGALPWATSVSINPTIRAASILKTLPQARVTLVLPWLAAPGHQRATYGRTFQSAREQETEIRRWISSEGGMPSESHTLQIVFYPATYVAEAMTVFPTVSLLTLVRGTPDVAILEEPEHINWLMSSDMNWREVFRHVVGVIHHSYDAYGSSTRVLAPVMRALNRIEVEANCDRVIKPSADFQEYTPQKDRVAYVNGVRESLLKIGDIRAANPASLPFSKDFYYLGRVSTQAGVKDLVKNAAQYESVMGRSVQLDIYGASPEVDSLREHAMKVQGAQDKAVGVTFHSQYPDHAALRHYKTLVSAARDVPGMEIAEALAMNKYVVLPDCPSNEFFKDFPNALFYTTPTEFAAQLLWASRHTPTPLSAELRQRLSWQQATERLLEVSQTVLGENDRGSPRLRTVLQAFVSEYVKPTLAQFVFGTPDTQLTVSDTTPPTLTQRAWVKVQEGVTALWQFIVADESQVASPAAPAANPTHTERAPRSVPLYDPGTTGSDPARTTVPPLDTITPTAQVSDPQSHPVDIDDTEDSDGGNDDLGNFFESYFRST